MPFSVQIDEAKPFLNVRANGDAQLAHLCGLADLCSKVAGLKGHKLALVDLLQVTPHLSFTEHLQLGAHVAVAFGHMERVATVVPVNEKKGTSEKAAQKHGLVLRTFTDVDEAAEWLLSTREKGL
jgi:hypothetical protein